MLNVIVAWWYFAIKDPERLQNEEHIERMAEFTVATMRDGDPSDPAQSAPSELLTAGVDEVVNTTGATTQEEGEPNGTE